MATNAPKLSVTVLNYNYGRYLDECLDSILAQTFRDFEVIVVDDCSTDDSVEVAQRYLKDERVRLVRHESNAGFAASLIEGTEVWSRGDFLMVVSADDIVRRRDAFERQIGRFVAAERGVFCFAACTRIAPDGESIYQPLPEDAMFEPAEALRLFLDGCWALHTGTMFRRQAYHEAGGYRRDITMPLDLAMYLAACLQGQTLYIAEPLYGYRIHDGQMSSGNMRRNNREAVRVISDACQEGELRGLVAPCLREGAVRVHLTGAIFGDALFGSRRQVLTRLLSWLSVEPVNTLRSRGLWVAAARIVLGRAGFERLVEFARRSNLRVRLSSAW